MISKNQICVLHQYEKCEKEHKCNYAHAICEYNPPECNCEIVDCPLKHKFRNTELLPYNVAQLNLLYNNRKRCSFNLCPKLIDRELCTTNHCQYAHNEHELNFETCDCDPCKCFKMHNGETSASYFKRILNIYRDEYDYKSIKIEIDECDVSNFTKDLEKIGIIIY